MDSCKKELYDLLSSLNELNNSYKEGTRTIEACKDCGSTTGSQLAIIHIMRLIENKIETFAENGDEDIREELGIPETIPDTMKWYI
jgi:hypothetical protein